VTDLGPIPGGYVSAATAINSAGNVVGVGRLIDQKTGQIVVQAFKSIGGKMMPLATPPAFNLGAALDINDDNIIVGRAWDPGNTALIWHEDLTNDLNDLIPPEAGVHVNIAYAINNQGQIVCRGNDAKGDVVAVLLTPVEGPPGDLDIDCAVGLADLEILLNSWGPCPDCVNCLADLDGDCAVAVPDLLTLLANWG